MVCNRCKFAGRAGLRNLIILLHEGRGEVELTWALNCLNSRKKLTEKIKNYIFKQDSL